MDGAQFFLLIGQAGNYQRNLLQMTTGMTYRSSGMQFVMRFFWGLFAQLVLLVAAFALPHRASGAVPDAADNWPQLRGPNGDGQAGGGDLPLEWSESNHVAWKTPIHDAGWSSPVIWNNQVWVTTARPDGEEMFAVCLERDTGRLLHDFKVFDVEKVEYVNPANSYASPTSVVESGRLYVHFGTYGTACLDTETGKIQWTRRDLKCDHEMGPGSSLASVSGFRWRSTGVPMTTITTSALPTTSISRLV